MITKPDDPHALPRRSLLARRGVKVPRDKAHAEGWDYDGNMANVVVYGQACEQLKGVGATRNVQIIFGCPGIIIE